MHRYHQKHLIQEIVGKKCEIHWERNRTHTFTWRLVKKWGRISRVCVWTWWYWKRERLTRRWIVTRCKEKMKSFWNQSWKKTIVVQNMGFSRLKWVTNKSPETPRDKIWKICLSIFHNWKVHLRGSCEAFWIHLTTGASTREQVAKLSCKKSKNLDLLRVNSH